MKRILALILATACVCALPGCKREVPIAQHNTPVDSRYVLAMASYPEMAPYPDEMAFVDEKTGEFDSEGFEEVYRRWRASQIAQQDQPEGYADGLEVFFQKSISEFLGDTNGENKIFSPLNVYMALAMLAETTSGDSRQQILTLLETDSIEMLRKQADSVWNANYCNDGAVVSRLANSLWLNQDLDYQMPTVELLAKQYHTSVFSGEMGSASYDQALRDWMNQQTGDLLKDQISTLEMQPETQMALASTIYFRGKWSDTFSKNATKQGIFHSEQGDLTCDFMHQSTDRLYYWADQFSAVAQYLEGSGKMWLFLPDEGVPVDQLLTDLQVMELLENPSGWENRKFLIVNLAMPKFDVSSNLSLIPGLQNLGVTEVFDQEVADFSTILGNGEKAFLSQADHGARVKVDEDGVEATAYTAMMVAGAAAPPDEEVDFVLERPFLFVITSQDGLPLFAGVVNQPG